MPIEFPTEITAPVFFPKRNQNIARYMDLAKFLSLIQTKKLFFNQLDNFEDKYEGTLSEPSYDELKEWYRTVVYPQILSNTKRKIDDVETELEKDIIEHRKANDMFKKHIYISCWNKSENESYALWKIYAGLNQGIMIKSNIERIIKAFENTKEILQISEVKYIDYKKESVKIGNANYPIIHKNKPYNYEDEIRLIHQVNPELSFEEDSIKNKLEIGKNIETKIEFLIEEVIISPFAPKWFFDVVKNVLEKYDLNVNIRYSEFR